MSKSTNIKLLTLLLPAAVVIALDEYTKWLVRTSPELHRWEIIEGWLEHYYPKFRYGYGYRYPSNICDKYDFNYGYHWRIYLSSLDAQTGWFRISVFYGLSTRGALGNIDRLIMGYIEGYGGY